jgi:hypothetical protein
VRRPIGAAVFFVGVVGVGLVGAFVSVVFQRAVGVLLAIQLRPAVAAAGRARFRRLRRSAAASSARAPAPRTIAAIRVPIPVAALLADFLGGRLADRLV